MTSFIQWNINGFYKRSVGISRIIHDIQLAILCFQETNLKNNHCATIKNYKGHFKNRNNALRASGGVATFIKDTIDSENIPIISEHEVIATLVKFHKPLSICNIYIPDSKSFTKQHLKNIINQLPKPFILLGDFNSRNTSWGCTHTDHRGQIIEEFLEDEALILLNNNDPTRHNVSNGNFSVIDLTITNTNSSTLFDWQVYTDASKNKNGVGFSVITDQNNHLFKLPPSSSIFTAETHAIYQALLIITSSNSTNSHIIISDSLSALNAISNPYPKNELIQHIQKLIYEIYTPTCFMWVPSHIGISGNEKADTSAYEATLFPLYIQINTSSSFETFSIIHQKIIDEWQHFWENLPLSNKLRNVKLFVKKLTYPPGTKRREEVPVVFALIPDKTQSSYERLFSAIKTHNIHLNPKTILTDFEQSSSKAFKIQFPNAKQNGCFFYQTQCVWRKIQTISGMVEKFKADSEFSLQVRYLSALAFDPENDIIDAFETLCESTYYINNEDVLEPLISYFEDTWIGRPNRRRRRNSRFPISLKWTILLGNGLKKKELIEGVGVDSDEELETDHIEEI
ncbi:hypothetical protein QTP88_026121 [Uroleucon formosanum]